MESTRVQRAITLVLVGVAALVAASAVGSSDVTAFGERKALCLAHSALSSTTGWWPDPGSDPQPVHTLSFVEQRTVLGGSDTRVDASGETTITWETVEGEHRVEVSDVLSRQLALNSLAQAGDVFVRQVENSGIREPTFGC